MLNLPSYQAQEEDLTGFIPVLSQDETSAWLGPIYNQS